ncbi:HlyD family secretion protein [Virgibacillus phasianinus]|uniref:HlyD family secretion protein n=1 Tax=Virgibacillus phasianinus TaxID=2017483 RepID=A0A220U0W1_9BACI|nr:HlyD family secretion protein [Virgibacillus phasianinus]ASK61586.1 HlyD family secretion protein [Virgibacillus phasianinus]
MKRTRILIAFITLFILVNILLVYLDDQGTVERKSYINDWSAVFTANLYNKMDKPGVVTLTAENNIYFDKSLGSFQEFLVEKGAKVSQGDELYSYRVHDYDETKDYLTSEMTKVSGEIAAIETAISEISNYRIPANTSSSSPINNSPSPTTNDDKVDVDVNVMPRPPFETEYMKEQYIVEKEKELARAEAKQESIQSQLTELESGGDTITVESPYQGTVMVISESLDDPIMKIGSTTLKIVGELTEEERTIIKEEMPVEIAVNENHAKMKGSVSEVSELPKEIELHADSVYPFSVSFEESGDLADLLPGYHTDLAITTKTAKDATTLYGDAIFNSTIWKMKKDGRLDHQKIETGMDMANMFEITKGAKPGEWVAKNPTSQFRSGATFITPVKLGQIDWDDTVEVNFKNWDKNFVLGLLSR